MFHVMCRVSGGATGTRTALLKRNDVVQEFATREKAEAEARRLDRKYNNVWAVAFFEYWVVEP